MTQVLAKMANWKFILPSLLAFIYCIYLFQIYGEQMNTLAGETVPMIDMRRNYDAEEIKTFFSKIKPEGQAIHKHATGVVDMIFPFAYGFSFILLAAFFLKKITSPDSKWMYLSLVPVLLMIVDYIENFNTLAMLEAYPNLSTEMVAKASQITGIKAMLTNISMALPMILGIVWLVKGIRNRKN